MSPPIQSNDQLTHEVDRLNRVVKATKELNSTLDLSELARIILRIVGEEVGIERGTVWVMSEDQKHLTSLVAQEIDEEIRIRVGTGIAGTVAEHAEVIDIPDAYRDDRFDASFDARLGFRTRDIYCMPVRNPDGAVVGVLQLLNRSRGLSGDDRGFLEDISVHIGLAIENASRHLQILEDKLIEQQLKLAREIILIKSVRKQRLLQGVLRLRCPICLGGKIFTGVAGTRRHCDGCGFIFRRQGSSFLGSTIVAWAVTIAVASMSLVPLMNRPTVDRPTLAIASIIAMFLVLMFFRYWKTTWIALDLYRRPPADKDFDTGKAIIPSEMKEPSDS